MAKETQKTQGEAYAIFNSSASREQIYEALRTETSGNLELSVRDTQEFMQDPATDPKILDYIRQSTIYEQFGKNQQAQKARAKPIRMQDLKYIIKATCPNKDNIKTAGNLGDVVDNLWYTFDRSKPYAADIFFEHKGEICYRTE